MNVPITNSKFSSLSFFRPEEWQTFFDEKKYYIQKFAEKEEMRIQFLTKETKSFKAYIEDCKSANIYKEEITEFKKIEEREGVILYEIVFSVKDSGVYKFSITRGYIEVVYSIIKICKLSEIEEKTILLTYTHRKNEYDTIFENRTFNFRVEGGFYPGDSTQNISNEIFRDQRFNPSQISGYSYETKKITIGNAVGVPQWVGNKLNWIFLCSDVKVDGIKTTRNESSVPELISISERHPLYVFNLNVEQPDEDNHIGLDKYGYLADIKNNKTKDISNNFIKVKVIE